MTVCSSAEDYLSETWSILNVETKRIIHSRNFREDKEDTFREDRKRKQDYDHLPSFASSFNYNNNNNNNNNNNKQ
eukprot:Pgem_evm1s91